MRSILILILLIPVLQLNAGLVWTEKANFGGVARHRGVGFSVGNRGYMGLGHYNSIVDVLFEDIWEYDPGYMTSFSIANKGYCGLGTSGTNMKDLWELRFE